MRGVILALLLTFALFLAEGGAAPYATWAHSHFVWLSSDGAGCTPAANFALLDAYAAHNITVGAIDIDSGWATGYNTFVPRAELYPDFPGFVSQLHARGTRVILWMTSMIDTDSPNFAEAKERGAFVRDGFGDQAVDLKWWHGTGGLLDYTDAGTRGWWEAQMAAHVLGDGGVSGIDGWKCDGTDPYVIELLTPRGSNNATITFADYSAWYYNHSLYFTRTLKPDALIWSRPVDAFPLALNISAFLEYSPKNVMFSGWVGDQDPTFDGLRAALINIFESAWQGYLNFGSDTGGCAFQRRARARAPPQNSLQPSRAPPNSRPPLKRARNPRHHADRTGARTREVFVRWAQLNALLPLFENGGNGDHTPWGFDAADNSTQVTDMYRRLVNAHYALVPYFFSTAAAAYAAGASAITPVSAPPVDFPFILQPNQVSCWDYWLGRDVFVSPVAFQGVTAPRVALPGGVAGWVDFWDPASTFPAPANFTYPAPLTGDMKHPVFHRLGALLPLHVSTPLPLVPRGGAAWAPALTLLAAGVGEGGAGAAAALAVATAGVGEGGAPGVEVALSTAWGDGGGGGGARCGGGGGSGNATFTATPFDRPLVLLLRRYARGGCGAGGSVRVAARGGGGGGGGGGALRQVRAPAEAAGGARGAAVAWEAAGAGGGRYPRAHGAAGVERGEFEARLAGTFYVAPGPAYEEVAVFVPAADAAAGAWVSISWA